MEELYDRKIPGLNEGGTELEYAINAVFKCFKNHTAQSHQPRP